MREGYAGLRSLGRLGLSERFLGNPVTETAAGRPQARGGGGSACLAAAATLELGGWGRRAWACLPGGRSWLVGNAARVWGEEGGQHQPASPAPSPAGPIVQGRGLGAEGVCWVPLGMLA